MIIGEKIKPKIPPMKPGTYTAVCVAIYEMGEQMKTYNNKTSYVQEIRFAFEVPSEKVEIDGELKSRQIHRTFNVSRSKKGQLRQFISSWLGKQFSDAEFTAYDTDNLLGQPAIIQVVPSDTGEYANIDTIMALPEGLPAPETGSEQIIFSVDRWDDALFQALPPGVQERLMKSSEYQQKHAPTDAVDFPEGQSGAPQADPAAAEEEVPF